MDKCAGNGKVLSFLMPIVFVTLMTFAFKTYFFGGPTLRSRAPLPEPFRPYKPPRPPIRQIFQKISLNNSKLQVYSAYYDHRDRTVKVMADVHGRESVGVHRDYICQIWYERGSIPHLTPLEEDIRLPMPEPREGLVYKCLAGSDPFEVPYAVSFVRQREEYVHGVTPLLPMYTSSKPNVTFAVCVKPIHEVSLDTILQFIEIHSLLGAERFYLYNGTMGANLVPMLNSYINEDKVEVVQWPVPFPNQISDLGQGLMQFDCMYRTLHKATYVAQMDIDEVMLPRNSDNWHDMVKLVEEKNTAVLSFLHRLYTTATEPTLCHKSEDDSASKMNITMLQRWNYYTKFFPDKVRSKIIYRPERVNQMYTHYAIPCKGFVTTVLNSSAGVLQHYRKTPLNGMTTETSDSDYACRFLDRLRSNILNRKRLLRP